MFSITYRIGDKVYTDEYKTRFGIVVGEGFVKEAYGEDAIIEVVGLEDEQNQHDSDGLRRGSTELEPIV